MNITFLIGNGFDLSLGLKTTYEDAFNYPGVLSNQIVDCNEWDNLMNLLRKLQQRHFFLEKMKNW
mgnify:CR=1 FL=1